MVMQARKSHRINDGYFEKHQTHPYQNPKYNNSSSKGNYSERYGHDRMRNSPNGNSFRSDSPDSQSPRDRPYPKHNNSYVHKDRENNRLREKYSADCVNRSPKDQRRRETDHRTNHEREGPETLGVHPKLVGSQNSRDRDRDSQQPRNNKLLNSSSTPSCDKQRTSGEERVTRIGDWSEHISSSGKKYYYNCKTEVSQWEKPKEWIIRLSQQQQQQQHMSYSTPSKNSNVHPHDKHSTPSLSTTPLSSSASSRVILNRGTPQSNSNSLSDVKTNPSRTASYWNHHGQESGDKPPSSSLSGSRTPSTSLGGSHIGSNLSHGPSNLSTDCEMPTSNSNCSAESNSTPSSVSSGNHCDPASLGSSSSTSVLRLGLLSQNKLGNNSSGPDIQQTSSPSNNQQQLSPTSKPLQSLATSCGNSSELRKPLSSLVSPSGGLTPDLRKPLGSQTSELRVDTSVSSGDPGPPTPTHSEGTPSCTTPMTTQPSVGAATATLQHVTDIRKLNSSPVASTAPVTLSTSTPPASSLSCLLQSSVRPQASSVNPGLANHYREDLTSHVRGWPADVCEKQATKMAEESNHSSMHLCRVSAELKSARAIVRNSEIQATIQEQRILFLRQQIQRLEEMKSQNSYMSAMEENLPAALPPTVNRVVKK